MIMIIASLVPNTKKAAIETPRAGQKKCKEEMQTSK